MIFRSTKRKQSPATTVFDTQMHLAKKRKTERTSNQSQYVKNFEASLALFMGACGFCHLFGKESTKHSITKCSTLEEHVGMSPGDFFDWQKLLRYDAKLHGVVCYFCHLPQVDDSIHNTILAKAAGCVSDRKDLLAPMAYGIFHIPHLKKAAEKKFFQVGRWSTLLEYAQWLTAAPQGEHRTNLSALFLWYCEELKNWGQHSIGKTQSSSSSYLSMS